MEEARFVEQQRDDDERHEGEGGVPDDVPDHRDVTGADDPGGQRHGRPDQGAPSDPEALRLPDDEDEGDREDGEREHRDRFLFLIA